MAARRLWLWLAWLLSLPAASGLPLAPGPRDEVLAAALQRLREVFDIEELPPDVLPRKKPPQFMVDLFNKVADANGITRAPGLLEGDVVRSFEDRGEPSARSPQPSSGGVSPAGERPPIPLPGPCASRFASPRRSERTPRLPWNTRGCSSFYGVSPHC